MNDKKTVQHQITSPLKAFWCTGKKIFSHPWFLRILLLCVMFLLAGLAVIISTLSEISIDHLRVQTVDPENRFRLAVSFQGGTFLQREQLASFYAYTSSKIPFQDWVRDLTEKGTLFDDGSGRFYVQQNFNLQGLAQNDCKEAYCFQHRLTLDETPSLFWRGLIGAEDQRFMDHFGVDLRSIFRALIVDIQQMKLVQGGSTLTQQLVKNLFFSTEKTILRKVKEIIYAIYIEQRLTKDEIIEAYFNEIYWGSFQGMKIKGLFAAASFYFNKNLNSVDHYESAILVSLLNGPGHYNPLYHLDRLKTRTQVIYKKLIELNLFVPRTEEVWSEEKWASWQNDLKAKQLTSSQRAIVEVTSSPVDPSVDQLLFADDYDRYVFYESAFAMVRSTNKELEAKKIDQRVSAKAFVSRIDQEVAFTFYSKVERDELKAITLEKHQIGSILKPIIYQYFTQNGFTLDDKVSTAPLTLKLRTSEWTPHEPSKILEDTVTLRESLQRSLNRPVIRLAQEIGLDGLEVYLKKFFPSLLTPLAEYPSQLLGSLELSLEEIISGYKEFFRDTCKTVGHAQVFDALSDPNITTIKHNLAYEMGQQRFFGKTGTSNSGLDNLFVFFDGKILGVIWVGVEEKRGTINLGTSGAKTAFRVYQDFVLNRGKRPSTLGCDLVLQQ